MLITRYIHLWKYLYQMVYSIIKQYLLTICDHLFLDSKIVSQIHRRSTW